MRAQESEGAMILAGYSALTAHGFALPCYTSQAGANAWYAAVSVIDGDRAATIAGFELLEDEPIAEIPAEMQTAVEVGDAWRDVFLWNGLVHVGTPSQIFESLAGDLSDLRRKAPLSLLDLALATPSADTLDETAAAMTFVTERYGATKAERWFRNVLVRSQITLALRRADVSGSLADLPPDSFRKVEPAFSSDDAFVVRLPSEIDDRLRASGLLDVFFENCKQMSTAVGAVCLSGADSAGDSGAAGSAPDECDENHLEQTDILVVATGPRARAVARHFVVAPWAPEWTRSASYIPDGSAGSNASAHAGRPAPPRLPNSIHVFEDEMPSRAQMSRYRVIVWLRDDEYISSSALSATMNDVGIWARDSQNTVLLIAPSLPSAHPSRLLAGGAKGLTRTPASGIIDTSIARSPFWSGHDRRSVDRRIADTVAALCNLAAYPGPLRDYLQAFAPRKAPSLLSLAWHDRNVIASDLSVASESVGPHSRERLFEASFDCAPNQASLGVQGSGTVLVSYVENDFRDFSAAALREAYDSQARSGLSLQPRPLPMRVADSLAFPEKAQAFDIEGEVPRSIIVTAETPGIADIRAAQAAGFHIVRYTDRTTLIGLSSSMLTGPESELPVEIAMPSLPRRGGNRRLAVRGVDPRDIARISRREFEEIASDSPSSRLLHLARDYVPAVNPADSGAKSQIALPAQAVRQAMEQGDSIAARIWQMAETSSSPPRRNGKRLSDLRAAWSAPTHDLRRFVMEDGLLPPRIAELGPDLVPAQRMFIIDGDEAVPAFFTSRVFQVWARATTSASTSWSSRFQVGRTFEALPLPRDFLVLPTTGEGPSALVLRPGSEEGERLHRILTDDPSVVAGLLAFPFLSDRAMEVIVEKINNEILGLMGLPRAASDTDILERQLELVGSSSG